MTSPESKAEESKNNQSNNADYSMKFQPDSCVLGGKHAMSYENFVQKLFTVGEPERPTDPSFILNYHFPTSVLPNASLPASLQLKLEGAHEEKINELLGGSSFVVGQNHKAWTNSTVGHSAYDKYGRSAYYTGMDYSRKFDTANKPRTDLKIYEQKRSLPMQYCARRGDFSASAKGAHGGDAFSLPVNEFLFSDNEAYQKRSKRDDTRIVGSNFVMAASRPEDLFLKKIDKVLAEARNVNSWDA